MASGERTFYVVVERDEDGYLVGEVPQLRACYSQGRTLDELLGNMRDVIALCLEEEGDGEPPAEFVGVHKTIVLCPCRLEPLTEKCLAGES